MYRELFDKENKFVFASLKEVREHAVQTGEFESDILCVGCEGKLGKFESYAKTVLYGGQLPKGNSIHIQNERNQHGVEYIRIAGLDYAQFKLFLLSVLWRASISSRPFFKSVSLGPYEETLRRMIVAESPGRAHAYPCIVMTYRKHGLPAEVIGEPRKVVNGGKTAYSFLINGIVYHFLLTHKTREDWVLEAALSEQGELRVMHLPEHHGKRILNSFFGRELFK